MNELPEAQSIRNTDNNLLVSASDDNLITVVSFVAEKLESVCCPPKKALQIELAVEEVFVNIAHYAYKDSGDAANKTAEITAEVTADTATFTFRDSGKAYNPLSKDDPDITLSAEERKIGGLGIFMVKIIMDSVVYERENGQNVVKITKSIGGGRLSDGKAETD
ncbi:histidine kinase [Clostridia bacterium]|nr:histidine kinase [Clostridia bacterium]